MGSTPTRGVSKITFRADDALVERLDSLDASKSEVMREALREFLDRHPDVGRDREVTTTDGGAEVSVERGDDGAGLTVNINLDRPTDEDGVDADPGKSCKQCGAAVSEEHAFCPNCGEERRQERRCECGEEIEASWTFCPGCGRRSPGPDVLDHA